jgi:hypothetical protein
MSSKQQRRHGGFVPENVSTLDESLASIRDGLAVDGYQIEVIHADQDAMQVRITASAEACVDCLSPPEIMKLLISGAVEGRYPPDHISIEYPKGGHFNP